MKKIKNKIAELYKNTPENITMVSYGYKFKNNKKTNEKCIVFGVKKKKNKSDLRKDELLPEQVLVDGQRITTDVIEIPDFKVNACYDYLPIVGEPIGSGNPDSAVLPHRIKQRPIKGGISTTNITRNESLSIYSAGTLGVIVVDSTDGRLVGLTNNHVYTLNPFIASDRYLGVAGENTYQNITAQPADLDGGIVETDELGKVKRYFPLNLNIPNNIDAAITTLNTINLESYKVLGLFDPYLYLDFATTEEIDDLLSSDPVIFKAGRTTGPIGYPLSFPNGTTDCRVSINQINVSVSVDGYNNNGESNTIDFEDCISFSYQNTQPGVSIPGDSGSVIIALIGSSYKIIGLCFAGTPVSDPINISTDGVLGIANRIDRVAELLEIQSWNPDRKIKLNSEDPACKIIVPGLSSESFIYFNGKKYYQVGTTNEKANDITCLSTSVPTPTPSPTPTNTPSPTGTPTPTPTTGNVFTILQQPTNNPCCSGDFSVTFESSNIISNVTVKMQFSNNFGSSWQDYDSENNISLSGSGDEHTTTIGISGSNKTTIRFVISGPYATTVISNTAGFFIV